MKYREWGWDMFQSFLEHTAVEDGGFSSLKDANRVPPVSRDLMESFWLVSSPLSSTSEFSSLVLVRQRS